MIVLNNPEIRDDFRQIVLGQIQDIGLLQNIQSSLGRMQSIEPLLWLSPLSGEAEGWGIFSAPVWSALGKNLFRLIFSEIP